MLRNLAADHAVNVTLVVWEKLQAGRSEIGWFIPDYGQTRIVLAPTPQMQLELLASDPSTTFHMFSGTRGCVGIWNAFCQSLSIASHIGIRSEAYRSDGVKGILRLLRGRYDARRFARKVEIILADGTMSANWYKRVGYPEEVIYPFAYAVETPIFHTSSLPEVDLSDPEFNLSFVGVPLSNKGLDILLQALASIAEPKWKLHIVGDRDDRAEFTALSAKLGLSSCVQFYGTLPNAEAIDIMAKSDLLVLPSRWDGWGAVVNEALMCGVPAVCSDRCGVADLLDGSERGEVFACNDVSALRSVLVRRISQGKPDASTRQRIRQWSKCISGESIADYFLEIVDATTANMHKPCPPWLRCPPTCE